MIIILSSAKTFKPSFDNELIPIATEPEYKNEAIELIELLKLYSKAELSKIFKVSEKIARENYCRFKDFNLEDNKCIAIKSFNGEVFKNINVDEFSMEDLKYSNGIIRILSGLYGIIKPLDIIKEYRLEMATKLNDINLYDFWKNKITDSILKELNNSSGDKTLINLASLEYSSALNVDKIKEKNKFVDIIFYEFKDNKYKNVGTYAKKARGTIAKFIIKNRINTIKDIKNFNEDGYKYNMDLSNDTQIVFSRSK